MSREGVAWSSARPPKCSVYMIYFQINDKMEMSEISMLIFHTRIGRNWPKCAAKHKHARSRKNKPKLTILNLSNVALENV